MSDVGILGFNTQGQFSASQSFSLFIVSNNHLLFLIGSKHSTSGCEGTRPLFLVMIDSPAKEISLEHMHFNQEER